MSTTKHITPLLLLVVALLPSLLLGQMSAPLTGGARGLGLAGTGLNFQDIHAAWSNPAGLAGLESTSVALYGEQRFGLTDLRSISAAGGFQLGAGNAALVVGYYGLDAYNEQRIGLAYGMPLSDKVQLGAQLYTLGLRIPEYGSKQVVSFELGLRTALSNSVTLAARVANPMRVELITDEALPAVLSVGIDYHPAPQLAILAELEKDILLPARVRLGLEYQLVKALYLRGGVATRPTLLSFGVGYRLKDNWRLDFSAAYHQWLGFTPGFGLVYQR